MSLTGFRAQTSTYRNAMFTIALVMRQYQILCECRNQVMQEAMKRDLQFEVSMFVLELLIQVADVNP